MILSHSPNLAFTLQCSVRLFNPVTQNQCESNKENERRVDIKMLNKTVTRTRLSCRNGGHYLSWELGKPHAPFASALLDNHRISGDSHRKMGIIRLFPQDGFIADHPVSATLEADSAC